MRSGRDAVDHAPNAHDDLANAAAGALTLVGPPRAPGPQVFVGDATRARTVRATREPAAPKLSPAIKRFLRGD